MGMSELSPANRFFAQAQTEPSMHHAWSTVHQLAGAAEQQARHILNDGMHGSTPSHTQLSDQAP